MENGESWSHQDATDESMTKKKQSFSEEGGGVSKRLHGYTL